MAWNKYYILVTNQQGVNPEQALSALELSRYIVDEEVELVDSNKPKTLFIGNYRGNLIIVHPELPFDFFHNESTNTEKIFIKAFPNSEIAALIENSTVHSFGYALIDNGLRVRMKDGGDEEIYNDIGPLIPEEIEVTGKDIFAELTEEDLEEMREDMSEEEIIASTNFEASWRVPGKIFERIIGVNLNRSPDISAIKLTRFKLK